MLIKYSKAFPYWAITLFSLVNLRFILQEYAWADDWSFYAGYHSDKNVNATEHLIGFRPLLQIIFDVAWRNLDSIADLRLLRLIGLLGTLILSTYSYFLLRKVGIAAFTSLSFAIGILFLPTFQIYQKWATTFPYSWGALFALVSWQAFRNKHKHISFLLMLVTFLIYQPAATFGLVILFAELLKSKKFPEKSYLYCLQLIMAFISATLASRVLLIVYGIEPKARSGVINSFAEFAEKIVWIVSRPFVLSFRPFQWDSPNSLELSLIVPIIFICMIAIWVNSREFKACAYLLSQSFLIFFLMLLPLLPISENQIEFRVLPSTSAAGLLFILFSIERLFLSNEHLGRTLIAFMIPALVFVAAYSNKVTQEIFVTPYSISKNFILANTKFYKGPILYYNITYGDWPMRDFIGSPSAIYDLQMSWVALPMMETLLGDRYHDFRSTQIDNRNSTNVLDFDKLKLISINER